MNRFAPIVVMAALVAACGESTVEPGPSATVQFTILGGDAQTGLPHAELPEPLVVLAEQNGHPLKKQVVNFVVTEGGGRAFAGSALTDNQGIARDYWTLGDAGEQELQVRAVDSETGEKLVFATFHATAALPRTSVVEGTVSVDGVGIPGVEVSLSGTEDAESTTGADGGFRFSALLAGPYTVSISGWPGNYEFPEPLRDVTVSVGEALRVDFLGALAPWQQIALPAGTRGLSAVWGTASNNVYVVGNWEALRYDGSNTPVPMGPPEDLKPFQSLWGSDADHLWGVYASSIMHFDGTHWFEQAHLDDENLNGIWGTSSTEISAVGAGGGTLMFDGTQWHSEVGAPNSWLRAVHGSGDLFLAVGGPDADGGDYGFILKRTPDGWTAMSDNPIWGPGSVFVVSETLAFVAGERGLAQFDGTSWQLLPELPDRFVPVGGQTLWAGSATDVLIVGQFLPPEGNGIPTLLHWDGTDYTDVTPAGIPLNALIQGIWGTAAGSTIFIVGSMADAQGNNDFGYMYRWTRG